MSVPLWRNKVFGSVEILYTGDRLTLADGHTGAAWIVNTTLFSRQLLPRLECSVSVYNLLDERYRFLGSTEHVQDQLEQNGRTFRLKFTHTF